MAILGNGTFKISIAELGLEMRLLQAAHTYIEEKVVPDKKTALETVSAIIYAVYSDFTIDYSSYEFFCANSNTVATKFIAEVKGGIVEREQIEREDQALGSNN